MSHFGLTVSAGELLGMVAEIATFDSAVNARSNSAKGGIMIEAAT